MKSQFYTVQKDKERIALSKKREGDVVDVLGPLGNGFPVEETKAGETAFLIGGGIGVPPLYELSKQLTAKGVTCVHVLGFQSEDVVFYEEEFNALGETHIVTVDGTAGTQGFVTKVMEKLGNDFSTYYSCGPMPMLDAVQKMYEGKKGFLSFEQRMGCGVGACFACVCETTEGHGERHILKYVLTVRYFQQGWWRYEQTFSRFTRITIKKPDYASIRLFWIWERVWEVV